MKLNCLGVTFWFNIYDNHTNLLNTLREELKDEYNNFNINSVSNNLFEPVISAVNNQKMTNLYISQINLNYNMDKVTNSNLDEFCDNTLKLFELLKNNGVDILHSSLFVNGDAEVEEGVKKITKETIKEGIKSDDLTDVNLRFVKKEEDLFYKIITVFNKKEVKISKKVDNLGRILPLPLISFNGSYVEKEIIDISYEINDKYSFDFTKDYHTTEFYLNKMLYLLKTNVENDVINFLEEGKF